MPCVSVTEHHVGAFLTNLLFCGCVISRVIHLAPGYSFLLVARVHLTCRHGIWRLQSLHNFLQSSTSVHLRHLGHRLQSPPEALYQVDWTHLKAMIHLLEAIELAQDQGWVLMQREVVCWLLVILTVIHLLTFHCCYWTHIDTHIHTLSPYISTAYAWFLAHWSKQWSLFACVWHVWVVSGTASGQNCCSVAAPLLQASTSKSSGEEWHDIVIELTLAERSANVDCVSL